MPVHSSGLAAEGQPTFRIGAPRHTARLARGAAPSNPESPKGGNGEARQARPQGRRHPARIPGGARHPPFQRRAAWQADYLDTLREKARQAA